MFLCKQDNEKYKKLKTNQVVFLKQEIGATTNRMYQINNMQSMNYFITKIAKGLDPNEIKC